MSRSIKYSPRNLVDIILSRCEDFRYIKLARNKISGGFSIKVNSENIFSENILLWSDKIKITILTKVFMTSICTSIKLMSNNIDLSYHQCKPWAWYCRSLFQFVQKKASFPSHISFDNALVYAFLFGIVQLLKTKYAQVWFEPAGHIMQWNIM